MQKSVSLTFILLLFLSHKTFANPKIGIDTTIYDFGKIKEGTEATHIFEITNKGDSILNILKVRSSCGCTAVLLTKKQIAPGEKAKLKVSYNTKGRLGKFKKRVYLYSNDPSSPKLILIIKGVVEPIKNQQKTFD